MADYATAAARSLSKNEGKVVLDLEWRKATTVSSVELRALLGSASPAYARYLAHELVRKGWLERLRPGLFRLIPADRGRQGVGDTNPLAAGGALISPYFFSYGTACTHHGLTEQVFAETYIACLIDRRPETIRDTRYIFAKLKQDRFFGFDTADVLGERVQMARRERALVDALDRPHYAGGLGEVSRMVARASHRLNWSELVDVLQRWNESVLVQRLGYLCDLHGLKLAAADRAALEALVRPGNKVHLGSRAQFGTSGRLARPWNIIENVPRATLVEKGERPRRRVIFHALKEKDAR